MTLPPLPDHTFAVARLLASGPRINEDLAYRIRHELRAYATSYGEACALACADLCQSLDDRMHDDGEECNGYHCAAAIRSAGEPTEGGAAEEDPNKLPWPVVVNHSTGAMRPATDAEAAAYEVERAKSVRVYRLAADGVSEAPADAPTPTAQLLRV